MKEAKDFNLTKSNNICSFKEYAYDRRDPFVTYVIPLSNLKSYNLEPLLSILRAYLFHNRNWLNLVVGMCQEWHQHENQSFKKKIFDQAYKVTSYWSHQKEKRENREHKKKKRKMMLQRKKNKERKNLLIHTNLFSHAHLWI